jgi:tRNA dimethylallyltransferase
MERTEPPLIVIVGPTASGKTSLAIGLAQEVNGEIICADSRTVYKGMDIGTAKPTPEEQAAVPHWGLDLVEPGERFTAADFKQYALEKIAEIRARGKVPFLVGGTGLYVDAILFDYQFGDDSDRSIRQQLEKMSIEELHKRCIESNIKLPENMYNKRYLIRTIERNGKDLQRRVTPISNTYVVGIASDIAQLRTKIANRSEHIFANGVIDEAIKLGEKYGWKNEAMTSNIYPLIFSHLEDMQSLTITKERFVTLDWRLAKRQLTWLRRNPYIIWLTQTDAAPYIRRLLASW